MEALSFAAFFQVVFLVIAVGVIGGVWLSIIFGKE